MKKKIREWLSHRFDFPEIPVSLRRLKSAGFAPRLIFDVGAYHGEFAQLCRQLFLSSSPQLEIACFEPLESALAVLRPLEQKGQLRVVPGLVGSQAQTSVVFHEMETASSVLDEHFDQPHANNAQHEMRRLDDFATETYPGQSIDLLKVDTQGYELEVLKGAERILPTTRVLLLELNLLDIHKGVPLMHDVMTWLAQRQFVAYDIAGLTRRPLDKALWQADVVFVKRDDPLRKDKRWK
ncbi:MAG: FkbM family methyltransferase [Gemmataceae bacterium]